MEYYIPMRVKKQLHVTPYIKLTNIEQENSDIKAV